jgi:four helix bundle protein
MEKNTAREKSKALSAKIAQLYKHLSTNKKETVLSEQMLRSAVAIGANLAEAECALNRNGFILKIHAALERCVETRYWLETLNDASFLTEFEFNSHIEACDELRKVLILTLQSLRKGSTRDQ